MTIFYAILAIMLSALFGYLFGSIPNGVIIGKIFYHKDPRQLGSKNSGGTNVGRNFGLVAGITVILLDAFKIIIPFLTTYFLFTRVAILKDLTFYSDEINAFGRGNTINQLAYYITPLFGVIGHCYSIYIKFSGGKAVSSYMGFCTGISWMAVPIFAISFFTTVKIDKHVSTASIVSTAIFTFISWVIYFIFIFYGVKIANYFTYFELGPEVCIYFPIEVTIAFIIIVIRHKQNLKKLKEGKESKAFWLK